MLDSPIVQLPNTDSDYFTLRLVAIEAIPPAASSHDLSLRRWEPLPALAYRNSQLVCECYAAIRQFNHDLGLPERPR